jgi:hypothetical protein
MFIYIPFIRSLHVIPPMHLCMSTYASTSQEGISVAVPEEPEEQPEVQEQEVPEADEEIGEDLPECPDHRLSSFKRGKPRSMFFLPRFAKHLINVIL